MKKFWMMMLAAATLVGCQKSEEVTPETDGAVTIQAALGFDVASRATLVEQDGAYLARWSEDDLHMLKLNYIGATDGQIGLYDPTSIDLENGGETATFTFQMNLDHLAGETIQFLATENLYGLNPEVALLRVPDQQMQYWMGGFDFRADVLVSKLIESQKPQTGAVMPMQFTMTRLNALLKLSLANLDLTDDEGIESVTFSCEQPIAGVINVNLADLDGVTYPVPFTLNESMAKTSVTLVKNGWDDYYFSTLPATLKAGESYTVTVKTDQKYIIKTGKLAADLALTAGDITTVTVNMGDAATKSKVENLSEEYEYAIGYTDAEGKVWLLPRRAANRRPSGHQVGVSGTGAGDYGDYVDTYDLTKVSVAENGSLIGEVADAYRWKIAKTDDLYHFYYPNSDGKPIYLIAAANAKKSDGLAIKGYNDAGGFTAQYTDTYENTFSIVAKEGGYDIVFAPTSGSTTYKYVYFTGVQYRCGTTSPAGVVNFYRIQPAPQKTIYPVITKAADITEGTYAFLAKKADGAYYALPNTKTVADGVNTCPTAYPLDVVSMTIENGLVTAAEIGDQYKWVITHRGETEQWDVRSALDMKCFLWQKPAGFGIAICTPDERNAVDTGFMPDWNFYDDAAKGMQAQTPNSAAHKTPRWLYVGANANMTTGYQWLGAKSATDAVVLVKISDSTEQIVTE